MKKFLGGGIVFLFCACLLQPSLATATIWTIPQVNGGSLILDDWGIVGPGGRTAMDFDPIGGGFDWNNLGYQQDIYTVDPDYKTPDATKTVWNESYTREFTNANMDAQTNFYHWAYTSPANSHFFMSIEKDGDYLVKKNDMQFAFYNTFKYEEGAPEPGGTNPDFTRTTTYSFQPYALSDGKGWCGSVLYDNPLAFAPMAGQITFDFAFDAYQGTTFIGTQIYTGFQMRSFGTLTVNDPFHDDPDYSLGGIQYTASAVPLNTNPETGALDMNYWQKVSFMGGGIVPYSVMVDLNGDGILEHHNNSFGGFPFLLRADANRFVLQIVPEPGSWMLIGTGLLGLLAAARRKNKN